MSLQSLGAIVRQLNAQISVQQAWANNAWRPAAGRPGQAPAHYAQMQQQAGPNGIVVVQVSSESTPPAPIYNRRSGFVPPTPSAVHSDPESLRDLLLSTFLAVRGTPHGATSSEELDQVLVVLGDESYTRAVQTAQSGSSMMRMMLPGVPMVFSITLDRVMTNASQSFARNDNSDWYATAINRTHHMALEFSTEQGPLYLPASGYVESTIARVAFFAQTLEQFARMKLSDGVFLTQHVNDAPAAESVQLINNLSQVPASIRRA